MARALVCTTDVVGKRIFSLVVQVCVDGVCTAAGVDVRFDGGRRSLPFCSEGVRWRLPLSVIIVVPAAAASAMTSASTSTSVPAAAV